MSRKFTATEWQKILKEFKSRAPAHGLPERRSDSVVIGTFNIRKLGPVRRRSKQSWIFLAEILKRFDLIAVQEIMDDLTGFCHLHEQLGRDYGMIVSDVTGKKPGSAGNAERLGFLFRWKRIQRTALASDISYDSSEIINTLSGNSPAFAQALNQHHADKLKWMRVKKAAKKGKRAPSKPVLALPQFLSFIRQPHCVSFRIPVRGRMKKPYEFLVINAHLLYGKRPIERRWEFFALIEWLSLRAKYAKKLYHQNLLLLGDCNLDFDQNPRKMRDQIDAFLKGLNQSVLKTKSAAKANFPLLSQHPVHKKFLRTALRQHQTYDQIGLFARDQRLPAPPDNAKAGKKSGQYDYGVFNLADLIAQALYGQAIANLTKTQQKIIFKKSEHDISDHMPTWIRLPI